MIREKTGGRQAGTPNKTTSEIREKISDILTEHFTPEKVAGNLEAMEPKDRLTFLTKLLDYTTPKLQSTQMEVKENNPQIIKVDYKPRTNIIWGDKEIEI